MFLFFSCKNRSDDEYIKSCFSKIIEFKNLKNNYTTNVKYFYRGKKMVLEQANNYEGFYVFGKFKENNIVFDSIYFKSSFENISDSIKVNNNIKKLITSLYKLPVIYYSNFTFNKSNIQEFRINDKEIIYSFDSLDNLNEKQKNWLLENTKRIKKGYYYFKGDADKLSFWEIKS